MRVAARASACSPLLVRHHGPRKCIIYLEPRRSSPLYVAIEGFLRASADLFGPSEAHQYHPHSSMTGFIDIADGTDGEAVATSGQLITQIACHLHAFVTSAAKGKLGGQLSSGDGQTADASLLAVPTVGPVSAAPDYPHKGTHKIEVVLDTPAGFRTIVDALKAAVPQARIRGKRIGHISLAYYNKHVKTANLLTADMAERLIALAASFFASPHISAPSTNLWDIAFYELAFNSSSLSVPHRFNQIARWQL
ncbi:hypothetical protein BX070DRAFT_55873 [Coemansia spiralis]|nr:hypothetical protein BX070DRAFT_55873 [Coemansia spiralis]